MKGFPLILKIAIALTFFNTWVLIAEFVIDRYGFDKYLPFYRYGDVCVWEIAVIAGIIVLLVIGSRFPRDKPNGDGSSGVA